MAHHVADEYAARQRGHHEHKANGCNCGACVAPTLRRHLHKGKIHVKGGVTCFRTGSAK